MTAVDLYVASHRGRAALEGAIASGIEISTVIFAPDATVTDDGYREILGLCAAHSLRCIDREGTLLPPPASHAVAAGWRWRIERPGLYVLHDSLLPTLRGFAPLITALIDGHREVGVTCFRAEGEMDAGPVVQQQAIPVEYPKRIGDLLRDVEPLYREMTHKLCAALRGGVPVAERPQVGQVTYSQARDESDYRIDWSLGGTRIVRFIHAVGAPYAGAVTYLDEVPLRIRDARYVANRLIADRRPGRVLFVDDDGPVVVCGFGLVQLLDFDPVALLSARTRFQ